MDIGWLKGLNGELFCLFVYVPVSTVGMACFTGGCADGSVLKVLLLQLQPCTKNDGMESQILRME